MRPRQKLLLIGLAVAVCAGSPPGAACERAAFRIVLDVGHSPEAPGATSARGIDEYRYNLGLSAAIEAALRARGFPAALMLTEGGRETLALRARKAEDFGAALLISVHHDSVQPRYLESWIVEGMPRRYSDRFRGWSLFVSQAGARAQESALFARLVADRLLALGLPFSRHHAEPIAGENRPLVDPARGLYRHDGLAVLKAARMPAVLFEAGIIVNRAEEAALADPRRQGRIAAALAEAAQDYCALSGQP